MGEHNPIDEPNPDCFLYVGTMACGCKVAACVDDPRWAKDTAKDIAQWIRDGLTVERVKGPVGIKACIHKARP